MPHLSDRNPIDETQSHQQLLADLQCNILSSHQRSNTHYFLLSFDGLDSAAVKHVLRDLALGSSELPGGLKLESELRSRAKRALLREGRSPATEWATQQLETDPPLFSANLLLSAQCYRDFLQDLKLPPDRAFAAGMLGRDASPDMFGKLNDPDFSGRGPRLHALYMVGYDPREIDWYAAHGQIQLYLRNRGVTVREEAGYILQHQTRGYPIEPFGYRDGISQPLFYASELRARRQSATLPPRGGHGAALAPLSLVLVRDPNGFNEESHGTYVVYRKLKQNVAAFYEQARRLARTIPPLADQTRLTADDVADRLIGRRVDGQPLDPLPDNNEFSFPNATVCPVHAHVRKVNPRTYDDIPRIVRRSTVYGPRLQRTTAGRPELKGGELVPEEGQAAGQALAAAPDGIGLMFLCYQANIATQFEAIQSRWANNLQGGADTVIGQLPPALPGRPAALNHIGFNDSGLVYEHRPVVELLEGEYLFAPSLSFFYSKL